MRFKRRHTTFFCLGLLCLLLWSILGQTVSAAPRLQDTGDKLVIVIDPGHGGENEGTIEGEYPEKIMTLISAQAMYDELIQFDNVEVYMTRTNDIDMSLKERAEFAKNVDADFLFSIHYNASANHTLFGSEVWVSSQPPYNAYGYQFGYQQMLEMQDMGLFLRGIKTKLNDKGTDYYGILRESSALSVPAVIIEHCHVDEERDIPFCKTEEDWIAFGQADARAVAKYFGLSSASLGIDYSEEANFLPEADENRRVQLTARDETEPDVCLIELLSADYDTGAVQIQVTAADYDSPLIYYDYSIDGGVTYCPLTPWPNTDVLEGTYTDTFTLQLQIESGIQPEIIVRAYNLADLDTESNLLPFLQAFYYGEEETVTETEEDNNTQTSVERERHSAGTTTFMPANADTDEVAQDGEVSILTFLKICLIFVVILFGIVLTYQAIVYNKRKKRRRQRMKDLGNNRNHPR